MVAESEDGVFAVIPLAIRPHPRDPYTPYGMMLRSGNVHVAQGGGIWDSIRPTLQMHWKLHPLPRPSASPGW